MTAARSTPATLAILRLAMLIGVLAFGAVSHVMHGKPAWVPADAASLHTLRVAMLAVWIGAITLLLVLRLRLSQMTDTVRRSVLVIAWAIGEGAALFGGVYYFVSDESTWFILGLFIMLASFILFPVRRR